MDHVRRLVMVAGMGVASLLIPFFLVSSVRTCQLRMKVKLRDWG